MDIVELAQIAIAVFAALVGWPTLLSTVLTFLEYFGILSAEVAGVVSFWTNVAAFGAVLVASLLGKIDIVSGLDVVFGQIAQLLAILAVILGIPLSQLVTRSLRLQLRHSEFFAKRLL